MFKTFISALFKKNNINHGNGKGFTIIELIVVIAIIVTISAVVLADYRSGNDQLALQRSAHKLAQDLRRAQEMAMSSAEVGGSVPPGVGIVLHRIFENGTQYRMYADNNGNNRFDNLEEFGEPIPLERGVYIKEIRRETGMMPNPDSHWGSINFRPPDPVVNIFICVPQVVPCTGENFSGEPWIRIILALRSDPNQTKTVRVNNIGLIYVE